MIVGDVDRALALVFGVVGFIMLFGCANLANAAGEARRAPTRSPCGRRSARADADRPPLLTESLVLARWEGGRHRRRRLGGERVW